MLQYSTIAESKNFIVLDKYDKYYELHEAPVSYQTEAGLEREFIQDLKDQGYEYLDDITTPEALLANARRQLQDLNNVEFTDSEWQRFVEEYLDKPATALWKRQGKYKTTIFTILYLTTDT